MRASAAMGGRRPIWRVVQGLLSLTALGAVLLLSTPDAVARTKFVGYVTCARGSGKSTICFEGDAPTAVFRVYGRDDVRYRVCVTTPGGDQSCDSRSTNASGSRSFSSLPSTGVGKYVVTWKVHGHVKASWTYKLKGEGV